MTVLPEAKQFRIAGFVPLSTIDWPDQLSAVLFTQGCPWRCHYCHNAHLIKPCADHLLDTGAVYQAINERRHFLDAVVISGGEPLLQRGLKTVMQSIRDLSLKVGLHTSGALPKQLMHVLSLVDWIGLDIKALPGDYASITQRTQSGVAAWESLDAVLSSSVDHEVRITVHPQLMSLTQLDCLLEMLHRRGVEHVRLQSARPPFFNNQLGQHSMEAYQGVFEQHRRRFVTAVWR